MIARTRPRSRAAATPGVLVLQLDVPLSAAVVGAVAALLEERGAVRVVLVPSVRTGDVEEARSRRERELLGGLSAGGTGPGGRVVVEVARPGRWAWRRVGVR
jgi:hypothetical protein